MSIKLKFSGHQSFPFRNTWLTKGVNRLAENPDIFRSPDALVKLGVGKNMVSSIKYWCQQCQLIETKRKKNKNYYHITKIGKRLFLDEPRAWDKFLEDRGTLWLLHYLICTNEDFAGTTYYVFNKYSSIEFTRNSLSHQIENWIGKFGNNVAANTLKRDVNIFIQSYFGKVYKSDEKMNFEEALDCPLTELGLLSHSPEEDIFQLERNQRPSLPDEIFYYSLAKFLENRSSQTVSLSEIAYDSHSPGRIFRLDENSLYARIESLDLITGGYWILTETADLQHILIREPIKPISFLEKYYTK